MLPDSVTFIYFYLLNKMLRCVGIILLVELSKYLELFSMIIMIRYRPKIYIRHYMPFGLLFIESPCKFYITRIMADGCIQHPIM